MLPKNILVGLALWAVLVSLTKCRLRPSGRWTAFHFLTIST
jgi:hypothetical protein